MTALSGLHPTLDHFIARLVRSCCGLTACQACIVEGRGRLLHGVWFASARDSGLLPAGDLVGWSGKAAVFLVNG